MKIGDIVRYSSGSSALAELNSETPHGWYGIHCLGGYTFLGGRDIRLADEADRATYRELRMNTLRQQGRL